MTITLGDISVRYANALLRTAAALDIDTQSLQSRFNLSTSLLNQANARISIPKYMRLGQFIIQESGREELGLLCGQHSQLSTLGLVGFLAASAPTLEVALKCLIQYETLNSKNARGRSSFHAHDEQVIGQFYSISPYNEYNRFVVDMVLSTQMHILMQLAEAPVPLQRVEIEYDAPLHAEHYEAFFNCPVAFSAPRNAICYYREDLQIESSLHDAVTFHEIKKICDTQTQDAERNLTLRERVMNEISPLLAGSHQSIEEVALRLDLPPWTLRRQLKTEGVLFRDLVDDTRKALALIYIRDDRYSLGEITYLLGFSYPAAFQRAFRRWTGIAPGRFREELTEQSDTAQKP